ncbi:ATP-binding protein [Acanthopleuribacter pedis]|uniref:Orc1-like AAA ATPase domain-containing protein n=1 Tax=Acanthopleuribacter pedis TaxID=442870 RepID=A0A8J7Q5X0_9BACT|nr:ATP-binding protein [Acanthopleuribacter pedis]MBO1317294.1 hypothetical protein [Acanthopleuribacter pedis]MBO1318601.1 hypothetical protein [Acanthopleuribacter pedis]
MMVLLWLMLVQNPSWTWYEHYEQGVKHYQAQRYEDCLAAMEAALAKKAEPKRNQFTRAVQKIDYAPFYYQALSHYALDQLPAANAAAQQAFRGEVVAQSARMQADLTPIFEAYRRKAAELSAAIEAERVLLDQRRRLFQHLQNGRLDDFQKELAELARQGVDTSAFEDMRAVLQMREDVAAKDQRLRRELTERIQTGLDQGDLAVAKALFNTYRDQIPTGRQGEFETRIQALESERRRSQADRDAAAQKDAQEDADTKAMLAQIEEQAKSLEQEKAQLANQLARSEGKNKELQDELEKERTASDAMPLPSEFTGVLLLRREGLRQLLLEARFLGAEQIQDSVLRVNGEEHHLELEVMPTEQPQQHHRIGRLNATDFGDYEVSLVLRDDLGRSLELRESLTLTRPWYLHFQLYLALVLLLLVLVIMRVVRRNKARKLARLRHFNPYIAGSPVRRPEMFFGRERLMQRIQGSLHKNSFMIHGDRRIGKTSFLLQLKSNLEALDAPEYQFYPVFIDLQGLHEPDLFHHLMAEVCTAAADWDVDHEDLEVHQRQEGYLARHFAKDIKRLIGRLADHADRHVLIVLLMDEVDVLNEFSDKTNQKLRSIFMKDFAEHLSCIMAGIHLKKEWESSGSPWYNFFEEVPVISLDEEAARELILDPVEGIFTYEPAAVTALLKATSGHPYLIQKLCIKLVDQKLQSGLFHIRLGDVEQLLQEKSEEARA